MKNKEATIYEARENIFYKILATKCLVSSHSMTGSNQRIPTETDVVEAAQQAVKVSDILFGGG